ncbi:type I secretion system permease/ATPase [Brucella anthropi]|uniref:type I secretion system permease/ATPase n=1 Tax=Brucella anthropi TaxID=529 RepID=UPI00384C5E61
MTAIMEQIPVNRRGDDGLLDGLMLICQLYGRDASPTELTAGLPLDEHGRLTVALLARAGARVDLAVEVRWHQKPDRLPRELLPALLIMNDGMSVVLLQVSGGQATVLYPQSPTRQVEVPLATIAEQHTGGVAFITPLPRDDGRAEHYGDEPGKHWFWGEIGKLKWKYLEIAGAAALANLLAVATALFSRQIYDRVIPNLAFATLWVLVTGVLLAIMLEMIIRIARSYMIDVAGKGLDVELSSRLFERAVGMRMEVRPKSTGAFVNQVREFDSVREFFTSTTIAAISDLPFVVLFIGIIWLIGGPLAWVLVAAIPFIILPGLLAQWPLSVLSRRHLKEGSIRNGLLVEAMNNAETIKVVSGEGRFQRIWEEYSAILAQNGTKMRAVTNALSFSASAVQQATYVLLIVVGVYLIAAGELTVGSMMACSILSSRAISPLTQMARILGRWQQMKAALSSLEAIMKAPVERPAGRKFVHRPRLSGEYQIEELEFRYEKDGEPILNVGALSFAAGSATALLGTNGSGKSTLLKSLAGIYQAEQGRVLMDGTDMRQIDPEDLRRHIAYLPQDVQLFYGTLRENLLLGVNNRSDEELLEALAFVGADNLVREHPLGLDRAIAEGSRGVSGGQRQSLGLARIWLRDPRVVLLDEPTAALDHALETKVIANMRDWLANRTLVVATHRQPVLQLVDRAIVVNRGRIAANGPLEDVLAALSGKKDNGSSAKGQ